MQNWFSTSNAIVADSTPPETRTATMADMSNIQVIASAIGPAIQMFFLFVLQQDSWDRPTLHKADAAPSHLNSGETFEGGD